MKLRKIKTVEIIPSAPFQFDATFHKPDHFSSSDNQWRPGIRWQTWPWQGKNLGLKFINSGTLVKPRVKLDIYYHQPLENEFISSLVDEVCYRFNLYLDLSDFYKKFARDKVLAPIIKRWRGTRPGHPNSLYEYLIIGIVLQNTTVGRSIQMLKVLLENYGRLLEYDRKKLRCFWQEASLQHVTEANLRNLKLGYRAKSIKKIDDYFAQGLISEAKLRLTDRQTQKEALLKIYGVGPATVNYLLFDVFHHHDVFNYISPWEQKIYSKLFFDQDPEKPASVNKLLKYFDRFSPYRILAVHYIWWDLWWKRKNQSIPWLEKLIRL
jgi:3-methyladenine DNA glycosylase/8-oxoguanine DNA glycosylase